MTWTLVSAVPVAIWLYLLFGRGKFWRYGHKFASGTEDGVADKRVVAVIPARNEADCVGQTVGSLLAQDFPAPLYVIVVDDNSTDQTVAAAKHAAIQAGRAGDLTVISGLPLPAGWTGKLWALSQGVAHAKTLTPDFFLFTDADIRHHASSVRELVGIAQSQGRDLVSYMARLSCVTRAEKALIPAFVFFFFLLYPPDWIAEAHRKTAGAAGGCVLIRPEALEKIGGIAAIRGEVIDDCALARAVKRSGGKLWLGLTTGTVSTRPYDTFAEVGRMISRSAFKQLNHSTMILFGTVVGLCVTYLLPVALVFTARKLPVFFGCAAWLLMSIAYWPTTRFYGRSIIWSTTLPFAAVFYLGATVFSAVQYWRGRGGEWKGRIQDKA